MQLHVIKILLKYQYLGNFCNIFNCGFSGDFFIALRVHADL